MKNRDEFGKFLLSHDLCNRGVEIGTFKADFAKRILTDWPGMLYMVDVWRPLDNYIDSNNLFLKYLNVL